MTELRNALLLGASGLVGGFCLQALLADSNYSRIVVLGRRPLPIAANRRVAQKTITFDNLSANDFSGANDVFCAFGTTIRKAGSQEAFRRVDLDYPLAAARLARQAGARQLLLVSSVGADPMSKNFYLRTKGALEQEIAQLGFGALHIFRPSLLLGKRAEFRRGERIVQTAAPLLNVFMVGGLRHYRAIAAATVGKAMVKAAQQGEQGTFIHEHDEIIRFAA
jgi:uncharacterized protein YbjT (DUF2867 family)